MKRAQLPLFLHRPGRSGDQVLTEAVKACLRESGLEPVGISRPGAMPELADHLARHVRAGHVAGMDWFTEERSAFSSDPRNLMPTAKAIISVGLPYWPGWTQKPDDGVRRGRIARYAWGGDYHRILKRRMQSVLPALEQLAGRPLENRLLVDTARIVDRAVAAQAGVGWYGKHTCLITPGRGSWLMLGELLTDLDLTPDEPIAHDCGRCTICLDRCPTGAIIAPYTIDSPRCISFQTIEQRAAIPRELRPQFGDWVFGCDVCQEVCPYTNAAQPHDDDDLRPRTIDHAYPDLHELLKLDEPAFLERWAGSAVMRAKRRGLARNAAVALGNIGDESDLDVLAGAMTSHNEPIVRSHAAWAVGQIGGSGARTALNQALLREQDASVRSEIGAALKLGR